MNIFSAVSSNGRERPREGDKSRTPICSSSWLGYEAIRSSSRLRHHSAFVCESPFLRRFRARLFAYLSSVSNVASVVSFVQVMWTRFFWFCGALSLEIDCRRDFLGGLHRLSPKLKRFWYMAECESSVVFVGRWSELRQRVFVEKEYCNLRVDDVIQFLHTLPG